MLSTESAISQVPKQTRSGTSVADEASQKPPPATFTPEPHNVLLFLIGLRLINALIIRTFFQPDEYFQALEPAWQWAFGEQARAWITWEWKSHLRSAIHPVLFGLCYRTANAVGQTLALSSRSQSELFLAAPQILQAVFAAIGDYHTWRLASSVYGANTASSLMVLGLTIVSPWQWFCSTRTFSNSLETTLTVIALYNWPWHWTLPLSGEEQSSSRVTFCVRYGGDQGQETTDGLTRLRRALLCAAVATILRPTNVLIWASLTFMTFITGWRKIGPSQTEAVTFVRETTLCGSIVLLISTILDRIFYGAWVFPPLNFLHVNVVQSLATFYGSNDWHYYLSQGYPLLLTTALPFSLVSMFRILSSQVSATEATPAGRNALRLLCITCLIVPAAFSNIAHKEVRFISPLLPALHVITGLPLASFFGPLVTRTGPSLFSRKLLLLLLLTFNASIIYYTTQVHNSGIISLTHYLRHEFEDAYLTPPPPSNMTVGMLMPCHSTPWRSHLQYPSSSDNPGIRAWALTCEPPLDLNATERAAYLDEADQFYMDPSIWLKKHMSRQPPRRKDGTQAAGFSSGVFAPDTRSKRTIIGDFDASRDEEFWTTGHGRHPWPDYIAFFAQLEPTLQVSLRGSGYGECKRLFNSHWHDDSRRTGDVVVWCLDTSRSEVKHAGNDGDVVLQQIEEVVHEAGGQKILGMRESKATSSKKVPVTRVVEKPFWKVRD
ncbi:glycosylphosphatidylinositol anchor biosynthesis [Exophiala sideris]|uniref:Mannosyltransferase n=1 Tax=Exophiala sideris TaxID=1016849 RepID=A0ABR0J2A8_9EURO|nr:glycosylphosphatidylinositol anchor biosynthesis [Exophiala sideris]KAK5028987.1 glycosylphosphatidylinositol anchor biosynthesis [Exophiala sideris]KAK5054865.1 glycosylphosphatidylinositol anchor biosynthesis [Exophiala sideris]KAK5178810.1 glycosylphosphatidylinositol anchor biosynthesis [Eurotiomycetes sp. CCFEE 6388]